MISAILPEKYTQQESGGAVVLLGLCLGSVHLNAHHSTPGGKNVMDKSLLINNAGVSDELQPLVRRVQDYLRICAARAAQHSVSPKSASTPEIGSPEEVFFELYQSIGIKSMKQRRALATMGSDLDILHKRYQAKPASFGSLSKLDPNFARSFKFQMQNNLFDDLPTLAPDLTAHLRSLGQEVSTLASKGKTVEAGNLLREALKSMVSSRLSSLEPAAAAPASTIAATELRLNLIKVKCLDEMDAEISDFGDDKIVMGGVGFDTTDQEQRVSQFTVGTFSHVGSSTTFGGTPRRFVSFDLTRAGAWPRAFNVTMAMAEKDADGGFIEFLHALWDAVGPEVIAALTSGLTSILAATGAAAALGAVLGADAALIGAVVGAVVGAAVGFVVALIFESLKDDIFDPVNVAAVIPSIQAGFDGNGSRRSPRLSTEFNRDGARYALKYEWVLQ
jgi:hypothetical protein